MKATHFLFLWLVIGGENLALINKSDSNITIWVNVFIPNKLYGEKNFTKVITKNPNYNGIQALIFNNIKGVKSNALSGYFLTDNRYFSHDINAKSRIHQEFSLSEGVFKLINQKTQIGETVMLHLESEGVLCKKTADKGDSKITYRAHSSNQILVNMKAEVGNPCVLSPYINYDLNFVITKIDGNIRIDVTGETDSFPYYEIYARLGNQSSKIIYRSINFSLSGITTPFDLFNLFGESRELSETIIL